MAVGNIDISVIVPVYNDPDGIRTTLTALCKQNFPEKRYEVLVVDNGSADNTRDVIKEYQDLHPKTVKLLVENETQGSYAARNKGVRRASGAILAFIDADMSVKETWLRSIVNVMNATNCEYMGCDVEIYIDEGCNTLVEIYNKSNAFPIEDFINERHFAPTCCLVVEKQVFETIGYFDGRMISGGDVEFGQRVYEAGFNQRFEPNITMYHPARSSLNSLMSKKFRVGKGLVQYNRYHPETFDSPIWKKPGNYLPPHPSRFRQRTRETDILVQPHEFVLLYFIAYLDTLARTCGAWYEFFFGESRRVQDDSE